MESVRPEIELAGWRLEDRGQPMGRITIERIQNVGRASALNVRLQLRMLDRDVGADVGISADPFIALPANAERNLNGEHGFPSRDIIGLVLKAFFYDLHENLYEQEWRLFVLRRGDLAGAQQLAPGLSGTVRRTTVTPAWRDKYPVWLPTCPSVRASRSCRGSSNRVLRGLHVLDRARYRREVAHCVERPTPPPRGSAPAASSGPAETKAGTPARVRTSSPVVKVLQGFQPLAKRCSYRSRR
jgi:hypothetical protein